MIRFACPVCQKILKAPDNTTGRKTGCPRCGQRLQVPAPLAPTAGKTVLGRPLADGVPGSGATTAEMPCPRCRTPLAVQPGWQGPVTCPYCQFGWSMTASKPGGPARPAPSPVLDALPADRVPEPYPTAPRHRRWRPRQREKFSFGITLAITSLVLSGTTVLFLLLPCFWFLALPISGLAAMLGFIGLIASVLRREGKWAFSLAGMLVGLLMLAISGFLVLVAQARLSHALDNLNRM
jgi:hypothetical protein